MRPGLLSAVQRKALFDRLDQGAQRGVIWVAGPPGAGKTTLVSSYLEHRQLTHLWNQVDRGDVDAATFFHYMGLAASRVPSLDRSALPIFSASRRGDVIGFSQRYFIALREHLRGKMLRCLSKTARQAMETSQIETIVSYYERAIDVDPLCEGFYRGLMTLYDAFGRHTDAVNVYNRCRTALTSILRVQPSSETAAIYERLSHENST